MAAPIRFLSGRQQQQKIGIEGSTDNQKVLEVVGQVGIGTTVFESSVQLEVRGDASVSGVLTAGSLNAGSLSLTGSGGALTVGTLNATGVSTFGGAVDVNAGLDVDGQSDLDELVVAGVATFSNAVDINSTLDVDGDTQLDDLNVAGVSTFSSAVNATDIIKGYKYTAVPYGSTVTLAVTVASKDSTHRYNGTGSGNGYVIDGIQAPFLTLTPGRTYRFTNNNTGSHPLKFYLEADKTTLYETNVNFQDTYTEITVTDQTPIVLHYQCTAHGYMGNAVQTNANVVNTNYPATIRSTLDVSGVSTFTQLDVSTGGLDVDGLTNLDEVVVAGVSTFTGNIVAVSAEFSGNVTIAGTLTAEDKTNIDSLGIVTARTGVRVDAGGLIVTAGVSTFTDSVDINNGVGVVGGLTADSLTISGVTTGINAAGISSFVRIDVDGQADLDELVVAGVATFQGAVNFDVNSEVNIGTGVTVLGDNLHVTGIISAAQFIGDGSGITNLPGISTLGSSNLTDVNVSGTTTTVQLRISGVGTAEKFFVSTGGLEVDGQSDLDELVVAGVSTFSANTFINADLSVTGDIGASGIITATGIQLVAGSGLDVGAVGVLTALSVDVSTGGIDVDGQSNLDEVVVAGVATFSALADVNNRLDVAGGANIDQVNVTGIASFTQLDVSTGGIDVDGQATLDEVVVSGASTFTGTVKIDGALDIGVAGVDVEGLTNLDELIVAGVSTFSANAIFNNNVGVGTDANPNFSLDAQDTIQIRKNAGNNKAILQFDAHSTKLEYDGSTGHLHFYTNSSSRGYWGYGGGLNITSGGLNVTNGGVDISTGGLDVDGQTDLDELQVAGVSTFSAKAVFNTAYPSIDADNEIQVGTAIQLGKAGVITATSFSGDLTGTASNASGATGDFSIADKIVHTGDTDTAIRFPAANTFSVETAGSERLRISADGTSSFSGDVSIASTLTAHSISNTDNYFRAGRNDIVNITANGIGVGATGSVHAIKVFAQAPNTATTVYGAYLEATIGTGQSSYGVYAKGKVASSNTSCFGLFGEASVQAGAIHALGNAAGVKGLISNYTGPGSTANTIAVMADNQSDSGAESWAFLGKTISGASIVTPIELYHDSASIFSVIDSGGVGIADSIFHLGDTNTQIRFPAADTITAETGGTERLRITSAGNFNFLGSLVNVNATGVSSFVQLDVSTGGLDVDGQTDLDELIVAGVSTFSSDISIADKIIHTGDTNTALRFPAADTFTVETGGSERVRVNSDGKLLLGATSLVENNNYGPNISFQVSSDVTGVINAISYNNSFNGGIEIMRAKGTAASPTNVVDTTELGNVNFYGYNSNGASGDKFQLAAEVGAIVDGTPGSGSQNMPGALIFRTATASTGQPLERARVSSAGNVGINSTVPSEKLDVLGNIKSSGTINNLTVGRGAGNQATNTALGFQALNANTSGTSNVAGGYQSLLNNDSGLNNTGFGYGSLKSNTSGDYNIGLGLFSAQNIETGNNNVGLGAHALNNLVSGSSNVAIGYYAGRYLTGSNNTILGAYQGTASETSISDTVIISAGTAERLRITSAGLVGIGITNPTSKLHVVGDAKVTGVITATSFSGSGANLTGIGTQATNVQAQSLTVAGISTFNDDVRILAGGINVSGVGTFTGLKSNDTLTVSGISNLNNDVIFDGASYNASWDKSANTLNLSDNAKATFGTGNDLEIYHDGSNSYINITGAGNLLIGVDTAGVSGIITATGINVVAGSGLHAGNTGVVTATSFVGDGSALTGIAAGGSGEFNTGISSSRQIVPLSFESTVFTFPSTAGKQYVIESINVANVDESVGVGTTVNIIASIQDATAGEQTYIAYNVPIVTGGLIELLKNPIVAGPSDVIRMWSTNDAYAGVGNAADVYMNFTEHSDSTDFISKFASTASVTSTDTTTLYTSTSNPTVIEKIGLANRTDIGDFPISIKITNGTSTSYLAKDLIIPRYSTVDILDRQKRIETGAKIEVEVGSTSTIDIIIAGKKITS